MAGAASARALAARAWRTASVAQAHKGAEDQAAVTSYLPAHEPGVTADVCVVGCGPAGLALSAELASRGMSVCLVGPESKFTNNYGVWVDEFRKLGLEHLLDHVWQESVCYFLDREKRLDRAYGRVDRAALRDHLLRRCQAGGVTYVSDLVTSIDAPAEALESTVHTASGNAVSCRLVTLAGGALSAKFLTFEAHAPPVAAQTAYGICAEVEGYESAYDKSTMLFMDYRRTHSGMWDSGASAMRGDKRRGDIVHPNWDGNHGTCGEAPSFLYAMPLSDSTVFLEETCLVARPTLPFAALRRRLYRRCAAMGIRIKAVHDEEYSYIPVGGPLPRPDQCVTAFGAAANLVHPATGYSITRMLEGSGPFADALCTTLARRGTVGESAQAAWDALWPSEKRRQASFHVFGMELLTTLEVKSIHEFFQAFFALPDFYWRGFLASKLSSAQLMVFALLTFVVCSNNIRGKLVQHLLTNPAGTYMLEAYTDELKHALKSAAAKRADA